MIRIFITGATATGKSRVAYFLARVNNCEIISADSRQVYRDMGIGTGQVEKTWKKEIPHHLMGFLSPSKSYSAFQFRKDVFRIAERNEKTDFIVVGGTGLYIKALLYPQVKEREETPKKIQLKARSILNEKGGTYVYNWLLQRDPRTVEKIHVNDAFRLIKALENFLMTGQSYQQFQSSKKRHPSFAQTPVICLEHSREELYSRIDKRVVEMVAIGWEKEVSKLLKRKDKNSVPSLNALGYRQMAEFCLGRSTLEDAIKKIQQRTRRFAKRQNTFFKTQIPDIIHIPEMEFFQLGEKYQWRLEPLLESLNQSWKILEKN